MDTEFWRNSPLTNATNEHIGVDQEDPPDLLAFISYAYNLSVPFFDITSPNIERKLGEGTSSAVHLFVLGHKQESFLGRSKQHWHAEAGTKIAIKRPTNVEERRSMLNEFRILSHPPLRKCESVIDIIGWSAKASKWSVDPLIVIEASSWGDLSGLLLNETPCSAAQAISISIDISRGLHALHSSGVIHGDLESSNILLFADEKNPSKPYTAKICDFGFSIVKSNYAGDEEYVSLARTVPYNAPECKDGAEIPLSQAYAADVFSYGMVLWDIWSHGFVSKSDALELEFKKQHHNLRNEIMGSVAVNLRLDHEAETALNNILSSCLQKSPQLRTRDISQLFPGLYTIASRIGLVEQEDMLANRDTLANEKKSESVQQTVPLLSEGDELISATRSFGRRLQSSVVADLKARVLSSNALQLSAVHYLLSFCYLTGYGTDISLSLAVEHMAKSAVAGSVRALSMLPNFCRALDMTFPTELLGLSQRDTRIWIAAAGYVHPRTWTSPSTPHGENGLSPQTSIFETEDLDGYWKIFGSTMSKFYGNKNMSILVICERYRRTKELGNRILPENQDSCFPDSDGNLALHHACFLGNVDESLRLLKRETRPLANKKGITPLHWLCQFPTNSIRLMLDSFLDYGVDLDAISTGAGNSSLHPAEWFHPGTPLSWAVSAKRKDVVIQLLSRGANPHLPSYTSALEFAANYHEHEILEALLNAAGPKPAKESISLLEWAIQSKPLTDRIMRHGERYKAAAAHTIRLLVERGVEVASNSGAALIYAIVGNHSEGNVDIMECLLQAGGSDPKVLELESPAVGHLTPLHCAMANSGRAMFRKLVEYGADVNHAAGDRKYTALHGCSRADSEDSVYFATQLLDGTRPQRADLEARDIEGCTPFMLACRFQRTELAKYLLCKGAEPYAIDNDGYTVISSCLSRAAFQSLQEVIPDLSQHDYICHPEMGVTALHHVAEWDELADSDTFVLICEILHAAPHILNVATSLNGRTALFSAVRKGNVRVVEKLL